MVHPGNSARLAMLVVAFAALQWVATVNSKLFEPIPDSILWPGVGLFYAAIGALAYKWFQGRRLVRFLLVIAIPALTNLILFFVLDNPGYEGLILLLTVPYAAAFCVGAGLAAWLWVGEGGNVGTRD